MTRSKSRGIASLDGLSLEFGGKVVSQLPHDLAVNDAKYFIENPQIIKGVLREAFIGEGDDPHHWRRRLQERFYRDYLGIRDLNFSDIHIPPPKPWCNRLLVLPQGLTTPRALDAQESKGYQTMDRERLEIIPCEEQRDPNRDGTYAIWVSDYLDGEKRISSETPRLSPAVTAETLLEFIIHTFQIFVETGKHRISSPWTACLGSRCSDGLYPLAGMDGGEFRIFYFDPYADKMPQCVRLVVA